MITTYSFVLTGVWKFLFVFIFYYGMANLVVDIFSIVREIIIWIKEKKKDKEKEVK